MKIHFTKMHGCGNDYVYVDGSKENIPDRAKTSVYVSDRHKGIGSDGLIVIDPADDADFTMDMYNADGSNSEMCGNGIRCVAKYVYDHHLTDKDEIDVHTGAGIKHLKLFIKDGKVDRVRVNMGSPVLKPEDVPINYPGDLDRIIDRPLVIGGQSYQITAVSVGNPHCIVRVRDTKTFDVEHIGPLFENDPVFPNRVNAEFITVDDRKNVTMRVWERGSGETQACGTGACAVAVACVLNGWTDDHVTIHLLGGDLELFYDQAGDTVWMTGPAVTVFEGDAEIPD